MSDPAPTSPIPPVPPTPPAPTDPSTRGHRAVESFERPGDTVGPYKLLEILGEGGFGTVWLAERREPMVQRVALKVIKPGMDSKAVLARFEQERQALAVMDHPHVARVFDAGATPQGRPYFVMEHVAGEPITDYCDRHNLTIRDRLKLFIPVCEAVQHAHHKGLIHRDLKPSNVLVGEIEGKPVPKVIDFGVAKAIASEGWTNTGHTMSGTVIGTPEYMSPEQVAGEIDVDTRADVYSLGVMLYELLTGELPFDSRELRKAALVEIQRIIREVTPPKPSTRLMQLAGARTTTIAASRSVSRDRLTNELRRELDWIPLMALRKERERRYASPEALASDVQRYLDGDPLEAAPDSRAYLLRKFVRRNRGQVAAVGAVAFALIAGLAGTTWQAREAAKERDAAVTAEKAERERADQLKQVSDFQAQMLSQIDTTKAGIDLMADVRERFVAALEKAGVPEEDRTKRVDALRQELVRVNATDTAAAMIDRTILRPAIKAIDEGFKDDPKTDASLRQALATLYYERLALYDAAMPLQEAALATRRRVLGEEHPDTLASINQMGGLLREQGKYAEAEPYYRGALEKSRRVLGEEHPDTLTFINNMGSMLQAQGKLDQAEPYFREALEKRRRVLGEEHPSTLISSSDMGTLLQAQGKLDQAEPYWREALEKSRRVLGEEHPDTLISINNMGGLLWDLGKLDLAEPYFREALEKRRRVLGEEHPDTLQSISSMGVLLESQGKFDQAELYYREALEKQRRVLGEEHPQTLQSISNMGVLLESQGKLDQAELYYREALEKQRRVLGEEHPQTLQSISNMGFLLQAQGKLAESEPYLREALEKRRRVLGEEHPNTLTSINNMGGLLQAQGKLDQAEPYWREALEKRRRVLGEEHPQTLQSISNMGFLLQAQGKLDQAEPYLREALEKRRRVLGQEHPNTLAVTRNLGRTLQLQGKHQEAIDLLAPIEPVARKAFTGGNARRLADFLTTLGRARVGLGYDAERFKLAEANLLEAHPIYVAARDRGPKHKDTLECVQALVDLYTAWDAAEPGKGFDAKAAEWRGKLDADKPAEALAPGVRPG